MVDILRPVYGEAWASSGEKLSPTEIKVQSGWVQEMMPYQWENFLQNRQDTTILYLLQKGVPEWSVDQEYIGNKSIVTYNGYIYQAKSTNTGNLPTDSVYWKRTSPNVTDSGIVTLGSGGTGATNATDARNNLGLGTAATVSADTIVFKSITGNAPAADKWTSPISLSLSGGATGNTSLDGSGNATINVSGLNASSISSGTVPSTALSNATLKTSPTGSTVLASGLTSERDLSPAEGYTRWNKTTKVVEVFNGTSWTVNTSQSEAYLLDRANHTGTQSIATISGLNDALRGMRNKIINGNFAINHRAVSGTVTLAAGAYGHDRWKAGASGCTYTFSTVQNVTTITITAGSLVQVIEGLNLQSGVHVLSWIGTAQGRIDSGAYGASGVVTASITGGVNTSVEFNAGSLTNVQLEYGNLSTPYEQRLYTSEEMLCLRYAPAFFATNLGLFGGGMAYSTTAAVVDLVFKVPPRVPPTGFSISPAVNFCLSLPSSAASQVASSITFAGASTICGRLNVTGVAGLTAGDATALIAASGANARIIFTGCEL